MSDRIRIDPARYSLDLGHLPYIKRRTDICKGCALDLIHKWWRTDRVSDGTDKAITDE